MIAEMVWSDVFQRKIRTGDWVEQRISTYTKILEAVEVGQKKDAVDLCEYFVDEAQVCYVLYTQWVNDICKFIAQNKVPDDEIAKAKEATRAVLAHPDRTPFDPDQCWKEFLFTERWLVQYIRSGDKAKALQAAAKMLEQWRQLHDRHADWTYALMTVVAKRLGEEKIEDMYRFILGPLFDMRYERFNVKTHDWKQLLDPLLYVSCEAMRSHLVGPGRLGNFELVEEKDRWVFSFDPCGSGGRSMRGDQIEGTPPRMKAPYNFGVTSKEYPWAFGKKGVCYYCAHCCTLMELLPVEKWGYPIRVVDPPTYPERANEKCRWYIYKNPDDVPAEVYARLGKEKPIPQSQKNKT